MIKKYIQINLASPQKILTWTERLLPNNKLIGEITKLIETLDHDSFLPIMEGLFCERIFGPTKDWECSCKRFKKIQLKLKNKITICQKCNVEITESKIRNYRIGYIKLASPVVHLWYLRNTPNYISIIINKSISETNKIISNKSFINIKDKYNKKNSLTGAEAINELLKRINLKETFESFKLTNEMEILRNKIIFSETEELNFEKKIKIYKNRLKLINSFIQSKSLPKWMTIKYLPVLPPNLRPIVKLHDNTIITTDLNFLYSKIVNSNNKIIKLRSMNVPETFLNNEKYSLQETVDKLINNEKETFNLSKKPLKSLSKILQGKKGRFRENLLGKTVDYSGRSVIIVEPLLELKQCGIPIKMSTELFQPLIIKKMLQLKIINTIKDGKNKIKKEGKIIHEILNKIIKNVRILLNRAPTLHRVGIQAFQPVLNNSKALQLHPLVCSAFNADFDGDQMGVHLPLTLKSQSESRILMISSNNCTSPATGQPNILPSQDMVLGCYFLTTQNISLTYLLDNIKCFFNEEKIIKSYEKNKINIHTYVWIISNIETNVTKIIKLKKKERNIKNRTTTGRVIFNNSIKEFL
uniref:DNA-directed RNA polymerase subunit n=1 Tax=Euglena archaeoplastidiata TaxID=1188008 RepID=A0A1X9GCL7_9EUGL|nr:RNA polymerase beta' subunit [Euglena archaeoplastidiata]AKR17882.1 RNA polymerase beta' subunit [Euglena archaeoplastidiata]